MALQIEVGWYYNTNCSEVPVVQVVSKDYARQTVRVEGVDNSRNWWEVGLDGNYYGPKAVGETYDLVSYHSNSKPAAAAPPRRECPQQYRIKTLAEVPELAAKLSLQGQEWLAKYGGRTTEKGVLGNGRVLMLIDGDVIPVDETWVGKVALHTWQDTGGLLWSYCTCCDASGEWDRAQYKYVERLDGKTVLRQPKETA